MVGAFEDATYATGTARLAPGEALVLFSDGVTEAGGPTGEQFGSARLAEHLAGFGAAACDRIVAGVVEAVREFEAGSPASDDLTALAVRYFGPGRVGVSAATTE